MVYFVKKNQVHRQNITVTQSPIPEHPQFLPPRLLGFRSLLQGLLPLGTAMLLPLKEELLAEKLKRRKRAVAGDAL